MGAIDPLLGIVEMKRASALVLSSGEVPILLVPGGRSPLTMPPLSAAMIEHLLAELLNSEQRAALLANGLLESRYESAANGSFAIRAQWANDKLTLTLSKGTPRSSGSEPRAPGVTVPIATPAISKAPALTAQPTLSSAVIDPPAAPMVSAVSTRNASLFDAVLDQAVERRASDVLLSTGSIALLRVDGELIECAGPGLPKHDGEIEAYFERWLGTEKQRQLATTGSVDFGLDHASGFSGESVRFRANLFRHSGGVAVALRPISTEISTLAELGLPSNLTQLVDQRHGLLLFTGATGSGKSTTLAALLEHINRTRAAHIVTLEDPIEFTYRRQRSVIHQREVGQHVDSFASGLRAALRENPDVLLVGEMRDPETIRMALTAAQTGHLVLSTLHSGGAIMAIERIIDAFPETEKSHVRQELASSLRHVVAQQLIPAVSSGRVPALEILAVNHAVAAQIRDGRTHMLATHLETGAEDGMVPMARALANLVKAGRVARGVAMAACEDRVVLEKLLEERIAVRSRAGS